MHQVEDGCDVGARACEWMELKKREKREDTLVGESGVIVLWEP